MGEIFSSTICRMFQKSLDKVVVDKSDGYESGMFYKKYFDMDPMTTGISDHYENAIPALASSKAEGAEVSMGTMREGYMTRYIPKTYALKMAITEEAAEDNLYPEGLNLARRMKKNLLLTVEYDAGLVPARGWNAAYVGSDGLCLFNGAHLLPGGAATGRNTLAVPMAPSVQALVVIRSAIMRQVGHDGFIAPLEMESIVCPVDQWAVWEGIVKSELRPDAGNFAEINVIKRLSPEVVAVPFWTNTTTNWYVKTSAPDGMLWRWRRKPRSSSWVDENNGVMLYKVDARWDRKWTNWRAVYGSQA